MKTTAELEREAYISGNIFLADTYAKIQDLEELEESLFICKPDALYVRNDNE